MSLTWHLDDASTPRGPIFTAVGTSVALTGGLGLGQSAALIISNPSTSTKTLIPLTVCLGGTGVTGIAWGFAKALLGTASLAPAGAGAGGVTIQAAGAGTAAPVAQVWGTATLINGTAGPAAINAWVVAYQVGALATNAPITAADLNGYVRLLPGESGMVYMAAAITGAPSISWTEV